MPTCLEAAGADYPVSKGTQPIIPMEGNSLLSNLKTGAPMPPRVVFNEFGKKASVRDGNWKLVCRTVTKRDWELYNLKSDPSELNNLIDSEPARVKRMDRLFTEWQQRIGGAYTAIEPSPSRKKKTKK